MGRIDEAEKVFITLLEQAIITHRQDELLYALVGTALLSVKRGNEERAIELYSLAAGQPFVGNSRWFSDVFGQHIEAASSKLQRTKVEQIKAQGEQQDLWRTANELFLEFGQS